MGKGSQFYNRSMKPWLEKVAIEMYSTHNKGKYVFTERFIRTLTLSVQAMPFSGYTDYLHFSLFFCCCCCCCFLKKRSNPFDSALNFT